MKKTELRFFAGLLTAQQHWLNRKADQGYRLIRTGKLTYEFEECPAGTVQYRVEFIGHQSRRHAEEYHHFLEDLGYRVFYKNINLNYSLGKVRWRPWAEKGGQLATKATTYNRELLIVEKKKDGKPFVLHTTYEDLADYYCNLRNPWLTLTLLFGILDLVQSSIPAILFSLAALIPTLVYEAQILKNRQEARTREG